MGEEWTVIVSPLYDGFARFLCILRKAKGYEFKYLSI